MGVVYLARNLSLNRPCALKMILASLHGGSTAVARFRAEAEAVARLRHPGIVQIYHVGEAGGLRSSSWNTFPEAVSIGYLTAPATARGRGKARRGSCLGPSPRRMAKGSSTGTLSRPMSCSTCMDVPRWPTSAWPRSLTPTMN